MPHRT